MKLRQVDPHKIGVPDTRISSHMTSEIAEMFTQSISDIGVQQPPFVIEEDGRLLLIDGLHRVQEAIRRNLHSITVAVIPGTLEDVIVKNLAVSTLHGRPKASEIRKVIEVLEQEFSYDSDQICAKTGLTRDYIERLMWCNRALPEVQEALDEERISVSHAYQLARVEDPEAQSRFLSYTTTFNWPAKQLEGTIKEYERLRSAPPAPPAPLFSQESPMANCHYCQQAHPPHALQMVAICPTCHGILYDAIRIAYMPVPTTPATAEPASPLSER